MEFPGGQEGLKGGWTVIQRRSQGNTNFNSSREGYKFGFGDPTEGQDFWLGIENIFRLTNAANVEPYTLRVELTSRIGGFRYAEYTNFQIEDETNNYKLVIGTYTGTAGDAMRTQNGTEFRINGGDHARLVYNSCDVNIQSGGWWINDCNHANLNSVHGITWDTQSDGSDNNDPITLARMMIKRKNL
ncbi:angiopoietin-related protein 1-like [Pecten maximus]|uniref:angiopoietin-related protein 1-like n=1 Tax=Pecten maximus TaxID=6579 RepID=UPI001459090F|nr:angiopoietin-related protein 1-like [Pecten maximus]